MRLVVISLLFLSLVGCFDNGITPEEPRKTETQKPERTESPTYSPPRSGV